MKRFDDDLRSTTLVLHVVGHQSNTFWKDGQSSRFVDLIGPDLVNCEDGICRPDPLAVVPTSQFA